MKFTAKICAPLFFTLLIFQGLSQKHNVKWGPLERKSGHLLSIVPRNTNEFFTLRRSGGPLFGSLKVSKHQNLILTGSGKIVLHVDESMASFEGIACIGDRLMVFLSDVQGEKNILFMQEYGEDLHPKGKSTKLGEYAIPKFHNRGNFNILESHDRQFFGVYWELTGKKETKTTYGFHIYDTELNSISTGKYELPYDANLASISSHHLSNTGDYFISVTEYYKPEEKKIFTNQRHYKAFHIIHVTPDDLEDFELGLEGKRVEAMTMQSDDDHIFTLTGIYGLEDQRGITGVFYLRADFDEREIIDSGFEKFGKDFITQDWSVRQKERAEKRESRGKGEPQLYNYEMREANILKDGSIIASIEQYYVVTRTTRDPRTGATTTTYTYYYNDIIAYRVGKNGAFDWITKIDKQQVSSNDGGPFSSYSRFIDNGKLYIIFNDNIRNYDESGQFNEGGITYAAYFGKRKNAVGIVEIDLLSGTSQRETFFQAKDISALIIPRLFYTDYRNKQLTLYAVYNKKEKFGIISFQD
jgi:hypothetical protein